MAIRKIKLKYLEMFLSAMEFYEKSHLYREIIYTIDIRNLLKNPEFKIMGLHIVNRALPLITPTEALFLYTDVVALANDASNEVRDIVYEILIYFYKNFQGHVDLGVLDKIGALLLERILDSDPDIQGRLIQFWSEELPISLEKRFEKLLCNINVSESRNFLTTTSILLLHPSIVDPGSLLPLFYYTPPHDVKYVERKIDTNWRRNASFTRPPLFVETKALKQTIQTLSTQIDGVRATQDAMEEDTVTFTPTIDPNTFFTARNVFRSNIVTQDSFFVNTQAKTLDRRSNLTNSQESTSQTGFSHLRKRFLRDSDKIQREKALKAINYRTSNEQKQRTAQQEREMSVTLYRRYRDGDFPDLNVNALAILLPLQALLRHDKHTARQVFIELFDVSMRVVGNDAVGKSIYNQTIEMRTNTIMNSFVTGDTTFIATLLDIAINNAKFFSLIPQTVKKVAKTTNNLTLGIIYLEERLNIIECTENQTNKSTNSWDSRSSNNMSVEEHWVQLAELYRCLSEHDVLNGIFANKIETDPKVLKAIDLMAEYRFDLADDIWMDFLQNLRQAKPEQDFGYQAHFDCLAYLGDWDGLQQNVSQQFSTIDEVSYK